MWHWRRGGVCIPCQSLAETAPAPAQRQAKRRHEATCVPEADSTVLGVKGATPLEALRLLKAALSDDPAAQGTWRSKARVVAVLGSCPRSRASLHSGGIVETALFGTRRPTVRNCVSERRVCFMSCLGQRLSAGAALALIAFCGGDSLFGTGLSLIPNRAVSACQGCMGLWCVPLRSYRGSWPRGRNSLLPCVARAVPTDTPW